MNKNAPLYIAIFCFFLFLLIGAIEGKSIKDCVQLGNTLEKCQQTNGVR